MFSGLVYFKCLQHQFPPQTNKIFLIMIIFWVSKTGHEFWSSWLNVRVRLSKYWFIPCASGAALVLNRLLFDLCCISGQEELEHQPLFFFSQVVQRHSWSPQHSYVIKMRHGQPHARGALRRLPLHQMDLCRVSRLDPLWLDAHTGYIDYSILRQKTTCK